MRSLGVTLTLAFIGVTLAATILVAAVVSRSTFSGFISYLDAETSQLLADAGDEDSSGPNGDQNSKNSDINPTFNQNNNDPATVPLNSGRLAQGDH